MAELRKMAYYKGTEHQRGGYIMEKTTNALSPELLAIGICHAIYRNTEVEDYHSDDRLMDEALYRDVYQIVSNAIPLLLGVKNLLLTICTDGASKLLPWDKCPNTKEEISFFGDIIFGVQCGLEWDEPTDIEEAPGEDLAEYLLGGTFKTFCDGKRHLDDSVMRPINKDITNRAYKVLKEIILANN